MAADRGQVAWEFVMFIAFSLFILLLFVAPLSEFLGRESGATTDAVMYDLARSIQQEVILASSVHPGLSTTFAIPDGALATEVAKSPYRVSNTAASVAISYRGGDIVFPTPTLRGNFTNGTNVIRNRAGVVYVN